MFKKDTKNTKNNFKSPVEYINEIWNEFINNLKIECEKNNQTPNKYFKFLKVENNKAYINYVDVNIKITLNNLLNKGIINTFILNTETDQYEKLDSFICFDTSGEIINRKLKLSKEEIETKKTKKKYIDRILNSEHSKQYLDEISARQKYVFSIAYPTYKEYSELTEAPFLYEWTTQNKNLIFDISDNTIENYKKAQLIEQ